MLKLLILILLGWGCVVFLAWWQQGNMLYFPVALQKAPPASMQAVTLVTKDKLELTAWYHAAKDSRLTVIYLHGNAGNIASRVPTITPWIQQGYGVLLVAYRGYSNNPGTPSEQGFYLDAMAAGDFLLSQGIESPCWVIFGESIGSAVSIELASHFPKLGGLILQAPFTTLKDIARYHYPWLPVKWLLKEKYDNLSKIKKVKTPLLIIHGADDNIIPIEQGLKVFENANEKKQFLKIKHAGHNNLSTPAWYQAVDDFVKKIACRTNHTNKQKKQ